MIRVNKENFEEEVLKYKGKVVVEFWSETCQTSNGDVTIENIENMIKKFV